MNQVDPPRHAASPDGASNARTTASRQQSSEPSLPHEQDESCQSQARATPGQEEVGREAYGNATDGTADTDKGPTMDKVYNEQVAPDRGSDKPRQ